MTTRFAQRFVLEREIGSGGMARVFLGRDAVLERPVAIKILKPGHSDTEIAARFRREGRTAAKLSHPNIVQVYDAGEDTFEGKEASYIVMEYVSGGDLKSLIDNRGRLANEELAQLGAGVAAGLAHAHEKGVIHRDVKPHNVLLDERDRPKLSDFGIARALDTTQATRTGAYLGTALYSPPEQLRGEKVTPKSDVYSLGVTFYQAATGEPPFVGSPLTVAHQHVSEPPTPPQELNDAVSGDLDALILDCMNKNPEDRPTADEVRIRLLEAGRGTYPTRAAEAPVPHPPPRTGRSSASTQDTTRGVPPADARRGDHGRRRGGLLLLAAALLLIIIGVAAYAALDGAGQDTGTAENPPAENPSAENQPADPSGGGDGGSGEGEAQGGQEQAQPSAGSTPVGGGESGGSEEQAASATAEEAVQTVRDHYEVAASDDYRDAWDFLSSRYQREIGSRAAWTDQFATLENVEFTEGPTAQVSGDTATVEFSTRATHTDRVDTPTITASLVREDGEWKIDRLR